MVFSQHFRFPCQYHFTIVSYSFIHLLPTLYNVFSPSTLFVTSQYHSTVAQYSFIHLPPTLYNVFLPVLQFSPLIINRPLLHTPVFSWRTLRLNCTLIEILAAFYIHGIFAFHRITFCFNLTANKPFDYLAELKYLRNTLTDQNCA